MHARLPSRSLALLLLVVVGVVACSSPIRTALCGLSSYGADINADLETLLALDPEQVAQAGTPDNTAALETLDRLDATAAEGQEALDAASEDEVAEAVRRLFQAALDATGLATDALRTSIDSGDPAAVTQAMGQVRIASDAIGAFVAAVEELGVRCPSASPSAEPSEPASVAPSAEPTEAATPTQTATPTPEPTPEPTASPTAQPTATATAAATATATATASPSPSPTATPTPSPTTSPTPSASASASESASAEPTPAPSEGSSEDGGMNLTWLLVVGAGALGALAYVLVSQSRTPPPDDGAEGPGTGSAPIEQPPEDLPPPRPPTPPEG